MSHLVGSTVDSTQGPSGKIRDFYFDDTLWVLRYLVCQLPKEDDGRSVLIPSGDFLPKEWNLPIFPVGLDRKQILDGADIASDLPVSRQKSVRYTRHLPWLDTGGMGVPSFITPSMVPPLSPADPHLRSFKVVRQYRFESSRGTLGWVKDFVIDEQNWSVYGLVVKLTPWYQSQTILVAPRWAKEIDWAGGVIWTEAHPVEWQAAPRFSVHTRPTPLF